MKYSLVISNCAPETYPAIYKNDLELGLNKAKEYGYDAIEWHLRKPTTTESRQVETLCERLNLSVDAIGTGLAAVNDGLFLIHEDAEIRKKAIARLKEFVDMGKNFGSLIIIGSMKGKILNNYESEWSVQHAIEGLEQVMNYAEIHNVPVVLEAINRNETNFLNTVATTSQFIKKIDSPLLKLHVDTYHMYIEEESIEGAILQAGPMIGHVHFADSNRMYPGAGSLDFKSIQKSLKQTNYQGYAALECLPGPQPDMAAAQGVNYLRKNS